MGEPLFCQTYLFSLYSLLIMRVLSVSVCMPHNTYNDQASQFYKQASSSRSDGAGVTPASRHSVAFILGVLWKIRPETLIHRHCEDLGSSQVLPKGVVWQAQDKPPHGSQRPEGKSSASSHTPAWLIGKHPARQTGRNN